MDHCKEEYENQHFGFSVKELKLEHRLLIKNSIGELYGEFVESMLEKCPALSEDSINKIRNSSKDFTNKVYELIRPIIEEIESLMETNFTIPDNVLLPYDFRHRQVVTEEMERQYEEQLEEVEKDFKRNAVLLAHLKQELKMHKQIESLVENQNEIERSLKNSFNMNIFLKGIINSFEDVFNEIKSVRESSL